MLRLFLALALIVASGLPGARCGTAFAAESNLVSTGHDTASLVTDRDSFAPGQALQVGLRLRLAPGWHTYWSNPGDAGDTPTVTVSASGAAGGTGSRILWPAPRRLPDGPVMSYGYTGDVVLPVQLALRPGDGGGLHLQAQADWLACAKVCIPEHGAFRLDLPRGAGAASAQAGLFAAAQARLPVASPFGATLAADGTLSVVGRGLGPASVRDAWFFPASPGLIDQAAPQKPAVRAGLVSLRLRPVPGSRLPRSLDGLLVLRDPQGSESFLGLHAVAAASVAPADRAASGAGGLLRLLVLAFAGGLVLNLMPCVFPVLAIKALGLARLGGKDRAAARRGAVFYLLGVVSAFAATGGVLLALRAGGAVIGWGFQFQSPVFVALACWMMFLVGLNLAGLFEVGLGVQALGGNLPRRHGALGDFATGLLAVLVAAPCTAPFMAAAIAGALAASTVAALLLFVVMGLGLALPYVVLALVPALARRMPRPGGWMVLLRQALAFPMFATSAWLLWVASVQRGDRAVLVVASGLVLLGCGGWLFGLSQRPPPGASARGGRRAAIGCAAGAASCLAATFALLPGLGAGVPAPAGGGESADAFSPARLAALRQSGRPVFVDMTAAWCVVCLVNERVALAPEQAAFSRAGVVLLRGDWTSRDDAITRYLRAFGRDGVPLYVYYPPHGPGQLLPQVLTRRTVREAIGDLS